MSKKSSKILVTSAVLALQLQVFTFLRPAPLSSASLTNVSVTLANPRLSYYGEVASAQSAGVSLIPIRTSGGSGPDLNTTHLFPGDGVNVGVNGGRLVSRIIDSTNFALNTPLAVGVAQGAPIYATQSGQVVVSFTVNSQIPALGYVRLTIPDPASNGNDGAPNTAATLADNGWDLNSITFADISASGGTGCSWNTTETVTAGNGTTGHLIDIQTTSACTAGTITITIGDGAGALKDLVNPAKVTSGHNVGTADYYQWTISTHTTTPSAGNMIDTSDITVAIIEGVLISATVDESLNFSVAGVSADSGTTGTCGVTRTASSPDTTPTAIPWGTLSSTYAAATHTTSQLLSVTTNADGGYVVTTRANDQMGRDGKTCTTSEDENESCIRDTACGATPCTHQTPQNWADPSTYYGLGYSLEEVTAGAAPFEFDDSGTFYAKQLPDEQAGEAAQTIMTQANPVDNSQVYVCYRIDITGMQPAGFYYNRVKYTASATF